jgi:hypothetical protein
MKKAIVVAMFAFVAVSGTAMATGSGSSGCGYTGCSATSMHGSMKAWINGHSVAYGDQTLAGSAGAYQLTQKLPNNDYFQLNGIFSGVSEGHGFSEAGGYSFGEAKWKTGSVIKW